MKGEYYEWDKYEDLYVQLPLDIVVNARSDAEELINFTCEVDEDFFVTFRNLYEKFYHKKFTINYTGNKIE